jgi:citrate/tricarballylate utilization protein
VLGTAGGFAMVAGAAGLFRVKATEDRTPVARALVGPDYTLLVQLLLAAFTGLALLAFRGSRVMPALLAIHLGVILSLFVLLPYTKFVHAIYRALALARWAHERPASRPGAAGRDVA